LDDGHGSRLAVDDSQHVAGHVAGDAARVGDFDPGRDRALVMPLGIVAEYADIEAVENIVCYVRVPPAVKNEI
jgi:hypothetical protein